MLLTCLTFVGACVASVLLTLGSHACSRQRRRRAQLCNVTAVQAVVVELPTIVATAAMEEECSICLASYAEGESLKRLPCSHIFHKNCVDAWLLEKLAANGRMPVCPLCKAVPGREPVVEPS